MYKKIKNGSFMNLFWFIICLLPLIFLIIFTNQYLIDNKTKVETYENYFNNENLVEINRFTIINNNNIIIPQNDNRGAVTYKGDFIKANTNIYYNIKGNTNVSDAIELTIEFKNENNTYSGTLDLGYLSLNNNLFTITEEIYNNIITNVNYNSNYGIDLYFRFHKNNGTNEFKLFYNPNMPIIDINLLFNSIDNYNYIDTSSSYENYLLSIYSTFESNGFINSTLLQVINYFNVNNVYMQLAILYIEYFIIIQLLHLFVDFMLLIPNICHKFMEKVGGERD